MKYKEILVDRDLYHLQNVLFDLDDYRFDADILQILNNLKSLIDQKLYGQYDFENYNVQDKKIIVRFIIQKNNKK